MTLAEEWKKISDGKVKLVIYPDGTQGGEADMVRLMRIGSLHGGALTSVGLSEITKDVDGIQGLPVMFRNYGELDYVNDRMRADFNKRFEDKGYVLLSWVDAGWIYFFSKERIETPQDLKKRKLFIWAGDPAHAKVVKDAGYRGVPLETADIQTGLQTGLIDVVDMPPIIALATQVDTRAKHMLDLKWAPLLGGLVIKKDAWDKIPADTRTRLMAAAEKAGAEMRANNRKESDAAVVAMQKRGLTVHAIDAAGKQKWLEECETNVYPRMLAHNVPGEVFKEAQRHLAEYRRTHPEEASE
jgi:TRAP-type C4-dicarboxylate transport system substrate-binding protein